MKLTSSAFVDGGEIPPRYTCEGADIAPPIEWGDLPPGTQTLALVVDDPDAPDPAAPRMTWVHWVLYDLPVAPHDLPERGAPLPPGTREGLNDWGRSGYGGPCPPIGRHRYFFKLYALDALLGDLSMPKKSRVEQAMKGHVLGSAQLVGTYQKGKRGP